MSGAAGKLGPMRERIHLTAAKCNFTCTIYIPGSSSYDWHDSAVVAFSFFFSFFLHRRNKRQLRLTDIVAAWSKIFYNSLSISCDCSWQQRESKFPFRSCKCLEKFIAILPLLVEIFHSWPKLWTDSLFHPRCHAAIVADFMVLFTLSTPCWSTHSPTSLKAPLIPGCFLEANSCFSHQQSGVANCVKQMFSRRENLLRLGKQIQFSALIWSKVLCKNREPPLISLWAKTWPYLAWSAVCL